MQGNCQGILIDDVIAENGNNCLEVCQETDNCLWFSYNSLDTACYLLEDCQQLDTSCDTCISGQSVCAPNKGMIVELFTLKREMLFVSADNLCKKYKKFMIYITIILKHFWQKYKKISYRTRKLIIYITIILNFWQNLKKKNNL